MNAKSQSAVKISAIRVAISALHFEIVINFLITLLCIAFSKNVLASVYFSFEWIFIYNYHKFRIKKVVVSGNESFPKKNYKM